MNGWRLFTRHGRRYSIAVNLQVEKRDLWVGVFWQLNRYQGPSDPLWPWTLHVYVCLLPLVPLHLTVARIEETAA